jgi:threonine dehydratase
MVDLSDIHAAAARIAGRIRVTPTAWTEPGAFGTASVALKLEFTQHSGSFKARGAFNRVMSHLTGPTVHNGVIAASGGNAGIATAYAARELGLRAEIFVPETAPAPKVARLRALGAVVTAAGREYAEAYEAALVRADGSGALLVHAFDQPEVVAGQGTLALELLDQVGDVDTVIVSVGGGGLMAGVALGLAGRATVVAVEPVTIPTLSRALEAERPVDVAVSGVATDSLGARRLGDIAFAVATSNKVRSLLVTDDEIVTARAWLWDRYRYATEHGAATAMAALTSGRYRPADGERIAIVLCGANTDPASLG